LAEIPHIAAVALGLALIVVEVFLVPGTLWFGIGGGILLAGGLLLASVGPAVSLTDPMFLERLLDTGLEYAVACVLAIVIAVILSRWLPNTPILRRAVLAPDPALAFANALPEAVQLPAIGAHGTALTDLRPVGKVAIDGRAGSEFEARSLGAYLPRGARVRVLEVGVGRLVVDSAPAEPASGENA
jgi:membrane-bound ClpP family serine protease